MQGCFFALLKHLSHRWGHLLVPVWIDVPSSDSVLLLILNNSHSVPIPAVISPGLLAADGCWKKPFTCFYRCGLPVFLVFSVHPVPYCPLSNPFWDAETGSDPTKVCAEPGLANCSEISFSLIRLCPGIHISCTLLCSTSFIRDSRDYSLKMKQNHVFTILTQKWIIYIHIKVSLSTQTFHSL
jgi:hypothetical protein